MKTSSTTTFYIVLLCHLLFASHLAAKEKITLHGKVISDADGEVIPYASISVMGLEKHKTRADDEGNFKLNLLIPGTYAIKASINADLKGESSWLSFQTERLKENHILELQLTLTGSSVELVVTEDYPSRQLSEFNIDKQDIDRITGNVGDALWIM